MNNVKEISKKLENLIAWLTIARRLLIWNQLNTQQKLKGRHNIIKYMKMIQNLIK
jgi:hypothetical protein